jgi:thioesterase domain-containing protein
MTTQTRSVRETEEMLCRIWAQLLETEVLPEDDFFELGGDSLLVGEVLIEAKRHGIELRSSSLFTHRTAAALAASVVAAAEGPPEASPEASAATPRLTVSALHVSADEIWRTHGSTWAPDAPRCMFPLVPEGSGEPLYIVHWGNNADRVWEATSTWGGGRPVYAFEAPGYRGRIRPITTIEEMADRYLAELFEHQPEGPYFLGGFCHGAVVAFEMARQLHAQSAEVALLAMVKPSTLEPYVSHGWGLDDIMRFRIDLLSSYFNLTGDETLEEIHDRLRAQNWYAAEHTPQDMPRLQMQWAALALSLHHFEPRSYDGPVLMVQPEVDREATERTWLSVMPNAETHWLDFTAEWPGTILRDASVVELVRGKLA